ncbi:hypothetical protein PGB90_003159 [Kerria lacca]
MDNKNEELKSSSAALNKDATCISNTTSQNEFEKSNLQIRTTEKVDTRKKISKKHVICTKQIVLQNGNKSRNVTNSTNTKLYKCNRTIKRYIIREQNIKRNRDRDCVVEQTIISKCSVKANTIRLTTISTEIINADVLRTYTIIDKSMETCTFRNSNFVSSTYRIPTIMTFPI